MRRLALCLVCALVAACGADEEPPAPTPYEFELSDHDQSLRALEARGRQGLERLPRLSQIPADAPSALAFEIANPDFFVRTCRGQVMRECGLLAMRLLQPYVEAVRQGLPFDDEVVELTAGLIEGYARLTQETAAEPGNAAAAEALREVTERFTLEALGWVGSDELDRAHQEDLVGRIRDVMKSAGAAGHDPLLPESCPRLQAIAERTDEPALRDPLSEIRAGAGCGGSAAS